MLKKFHPVWSVLRVILACAVAAVLIPWPASAALQGESYGENLVIHPPAGWRLAYSEGDPRGDYAIEFMPPNESRESWREGYMSVRRGTYQSTRGVHLAPKIVQEVLQNAQRNCPGYFTSMQQKDSVNNGAYTSMSGGFCDRAGASAPYGEGSLVAVVEGQKHMFLVQFGWRPATETEGKGGGVRIAPEKLQQYLNLLNQAKLCGGDGEPVCPR